MLKFLRNTPLQKYNTFNIKASAKYFIEISSESQFEELLQSEIFRSERRFILGGGSNILFTSDFDGLIIKSAIKGISVENSDSGSVLIEAGAAENWSDFIDFCINNEYFGMENLGFIPGSVGAAPVQNIGAYGIEQKKNFVSLKGIDLMTGKIIEFGKIDSNFSYRNSIFKKLLKEEFFILSVKYELSRKFEPNLDFKELADKIALDSRLVPEFRKLYEAVKELRESKLPNPSVLGNAGSFFKNPIVNDEKITELVATYPEIPHWNMYENNNKIPAAWLIEKSGWKGFRKGDCGVSGRHALILVNFGSATGLEILELSWEIIESVKNKFKISLEPEVRII
ncbi:MAG: murB [Ignavibacteria bacterium]|nr:murB [Ignavibacteria bacterium]